MNWPACCGRACSISPTGGFFSKDRWIRFSATGAHLFWRVKNAAKSVPFKTLKTLLDGSELVLLHESDSMLGKRCRDIADGTAPRLPGTVARLVQFTVTTRTRSGRVKTSVIRVLTTLLDHAGFPPPGSLPCTPKVSQLLARRARKWLQRWLAGTGRSGARPRPARPQVRPRTHDPKGHGDGRGLTDP
jgi:hypothetical protein